MPVPRGRPVRVETACTATDTLVQATPNVRAAGAARSMSITITTATGRAVWSSYAVPCRQQDMPATPTTVATTIPVPIRAQRPHRYMRPGALAPTVAMTMIVRAPARKWTMARNTIRAMCPHVLTRPLEPAVTQMARAQAPHTPPQTRSTNARCTLIHPAARPTTSPLRGAVTSGARTVTQPPPPIRLRPEPRRATREALVAARATLARVGVTVQIAADIQATPLRTG